LGDVGVDVTNNIKMDHKERGPENVDWINAIKTPKL